MKEFGGKKTAPAQREEFALNYLDANNEQCRAEFGIYARISGGDMAAMMAALSTEPGKAIAIIVRLLKKLMDNKDGVTPEQWQPSALPAGEGAEDRPSSYRGPDGRIYPFSDQETLDGFLDRASGTSRRRWVYLMEQDDDAIVEFEELEGIVSWITGVAADRPTQPRA